MAQDAELKLKVSLDLAFFRQQLTGLGQAAAGYNMPINVKFDRRSVQNELNALGTNIRRRNYTLEVKTNLDAEIKKAKDLANALRELPKAQAAQGIAGVTGERFSQAALKRLGQDIKPLYKAAAEAGIVAFNETIANNVAKIAKELSEVGQESIAGLLNGLKSGDAQIKAAAESLGKALISSIKSILGIASPSKVFKAIGDDVGKGFELGAVASMDRAFDELERKIKERLGKLQNMLSMPVSRRSAFPFVAMGGAPESGPIAREIDQAYAQLAQIQERRQGRLSFERGALAQAAGRLLPPGRDRSLPAGRETIIPGGGALDQVTQGFIQSLRNTRDTLARNFSANTYLPKATRALATSMEVATKQLSGTKIAGLLPSKEMMEPLRFQRAQQRAAQIDAENIARQQAQQAAQQASLRGMFEGVPRINAPRVGQEETAIGRHIQNKVEQAIRNARQTLGLSIGPSSPYIPNPFAGAATIPPRQYFQAGGQAALPPAGGTGLFAELQRGTQEMLRRNERMIASTDRVMAALDRMSGFIPSIKSSSRFPMEGMMGPSSPLGRITAQSSMFAGGAGAMPPGGGGGGGRGGFGGTGGFGGLGGFGRAMGGINLPGAGTIRELGSEFAFATKQVLLFGQAYKMLGFLQNFPGQVGQAVAELQSFKNTLSAISPTAEEARLSNELILGLVERYNIPLESARQGFVKLYASMEPAGFSGKEISDLFTGVSKASATLGLSADKVDRVTYAFAQMASKGQIMSEEVTGQLGDVIPGALSIMAEAANMGLAEFKKAMEDGEFVGKRFTEVMNNVPKVLEDRFGKGAEGAAKTFQGALNNMQTSLKLFYQSFEPAAVAFLNTFVTPIAKQLRELADGFNAFFTGSEAKTFGGEQLAAELNALRPAFEGIIANAKEFVPLLQTLGDIALGAVKAFTVLAGNPVAGFLAKTYAQALLLTTAFKVLAANAIVQTIRSLIQMVAQLTITRQTMLSTQVQMALLTSNAGALSAAFRSGALAVAGLGAAIKTALLGGVITAAIVLIDQLIGRIQQLKAEAASVEARGKGARQEVKAAYAGGVEAGRSAAAGKEAEARSASRLSDIYRNLAQGKTISSADYKFAQDQGASLPGVTKRNSGRYAPDMPETLTGGVSVKYKSEYERLSLQQAQTAENIRQGVALGQREGETAAAAQAARNARRERALAGEIEAAGKTTKGKGKKERESQVPVLQLELATTEQLFELEKQMMIAQLGGNELEVVRLNGLKEQLRFNEQIAKVKLDNELPASEKVLQIQRLTKEAELARLQTNFDLERKILETYKRVNDSVIEIAKQASMELSDKKEYERLVTEGILPSTARITVEVNRQFAIEAEKLKMLEEQIKDQVALLEAKESLTKEDEAQLRILRDRLRETGSGIAQMPQLAQQTIETRVQSEQAPNSMVALAEYIQNLRQELQQLISVQNLAAVSARGIGEALGEAMTNGVASLVSGTATAKEVFANFLQSVGQALSQAASQMIATYISIGIAKMFAGLSGGGLFGGSPSIQGGGFGSFTGGSFGTGGVADLPGLGGAGALAGGSSIPSYAGLKFASGGIAQGGFRAFANGGVVSGPTLGLVGEGKYNEAIVPLPDGKSIPVQLGAGSVRDMMNSQSSSSSPVLNMSFESTKINGVEYVSREQLEQAMAATRRQAANDGAKRGMSMTLDRIQQSPQTRSRLGIR